MCRSRECADECVKSPKFRLDSVEDDSDDSDTTVKLLPSNTFTCSSRGSFECLGVIDALAQGTIYDVAIVFPHNRFLLPAPPCKHIDRLVSTFDSSRFRQCLCASVLLPSGISLQSSER